MHSSRMHTARLLTVSPSMHCTGGGACSRDVCSIPAYTEADPPLMNRITDSCKNITFPQLRLWPVIITTHKVWRKVIFSVACVKNSVHRGSASLHAGIRPPPPPGTTRADTPRTRHSLGEDTPLEQTPQEQCMLGDSVNKRAVCILLECNLVK